MKVIAPAAGSLGAALFFWALAPAAVAQPLPQCQRYPVAQDTYTCFCPAGGRPGSVWGSGPYTADSDLCAAARHSGMLTEAGGAIMAIRTAGQAEYQDSERNGIRTSRWGRYDVSVMFAPAQAVVPPPAPPPSPFGAQPASPFGTPPAPTNPFQQAQPPAPFPVPAPPAETVIAECAGLGPDIETRCSCPPNGGTGPVWGNGPYTSDSDLCTAARHSGAIGLAGGEISVIRLPGLTSYKAAERNGILTMDWGEYGESFIVNANN